jgi:ADP-heptose:LPS heptosyltransferase
LTIFSKLFFFIKPSKKQVNNVLFIGLSEMGSVILAEPAIKKVSKIINSSNFYVIFEKNKPGLNFSNIILDDHIFSIRSNSVIFFILDTISFFFWCRKKKIDATIDLEMFSRFSAILSFISGGAKRIGFYSFHQEGLYRGRMMTHPVAYNPYIHIAKNFVALVNELLHSTMNLPSSKNVILDEEIVLSKTEISNEFKEEIRIKLKKKTSVYDSSLHRLVLFNANCSDLVPLRKWPIENFIQLAKTVFSKHPNVMILLTGSCQERSNLQKIEDSLSNEKILNIAGFFSVQELLALYEISELMVTNDSGPAHFSSLTNMPSFVLFGPETPKLYSPLGVSHNIYLGLSCSPCLSAYNHRKSYCKDNVCMKRITPVMVYQKIAPLLNHSRFS